MSAPEETFALHLRAAGLPAPERELVFALPRRWRFDFAWPAHQLAVEIEGGTWVQGAHGRGRHFESDAEKYNAAVLLGWRILRFTTDMVNDGRALLTTERALSGQSETPVPSSQEEGGRLGESVAR